MSAPPETFPNKGRQTVSRKLRGMKPRKVNRGAFEERKQREENQYETQRALMFILPLLMLAVLAVGIFFGYKFYQSSVSDHNAVAPSEPLETNELLENPMFLRSVNSASKLDADYVPELVESSGISVSPEVALPLERLVADAKKQGYDFIVREGYVSYEDQQDRYEEAVEKYRKDKKSSLIMAEANVKREIPPGGESEQQTGLVVDLSVKTDGKFVDTPAYAWLIRNCVDYGFVQRYPSNDNAGGFAFSSHLFRYVGEEYAREMRAYNMNFDRFTNYLAMQ